MAAISFLARVRDVFERVPIPPFPRFERCSLRSHHAWMPKRQQKAAFTCCAAAPSLLIRLMRAPHSGGSNLRNPEVPTNLPGQSIRDLGVSRQRFDLAVRWVRPE